MERRATIVDFVENATGSDAASLVDLVQADPDLLLRRKMEIVGLFSETWLGSDLAYERANEEPGELWPVLPVGEVDVLEGVQLPTLRSRVGPAHRAAQASRRDVQSLLLYAHGVHLPNPLSFADDEPSDPAFLRAVLGVCTLAPLISAGVVRTYEPGAQRHLNLVGDAAAAFEALADRIGLALRAYEDRNLDQSMLKDAALALLDRAVDRLIAMVDGEDPGSGTLLFPTRFDAPATRALVSLLGVEDVATTRRDERYVHLEDLARLSLPGLRNLNTREMVEIRSDDSFGLFRSDVAAALRDAESDLGHGRLAAARRTLSEHMDAGVARLHLQTRRGALADAVVGDAVGWALGAAVAASVAGLSGALATLIGKGATEVLRARPTPGRSALRAHYIELGTASLDVPSDDIDFESFDFGSFWDEGPRAVTRAARRHAIVADLLRGFEGE